MNEILKADFRNARIGDRVRAITGFCAEITKIEDGNIRGVYDSRDKETFTVNLDGTFYCDGSKRNSLPFMFYHFEGQFPTIEACTRPLPTIEVDEKVLVWCRHDDRWIKRYAEGGFNGSALRTFKNGGTSWSTDFVESWYKWKLASDPTINSGNLDEIEGENGKG